MLILHIIACFNKTLFVYLDIDECSSSPCGPNTKYNCTNLMGSYKCSTCALQGYILDKVTKKCGGMYGNRLISALIRRLVEYIVVT